VNETPVTERPPELEALMPQNGGAGRVPAEIPLVEWGTLALRAGRREPVLPHMGWMLRFPELVGRHEIEAEARRIASSPYGLGRRIAPARIFGGRPRWVQSTAAPAVAFSPVTTAEGDALAAWIDGHLSVRLDPEFGTGWHVAATHTDAGDTVVIFIVHHLFGIARPLVGAIYAPDTEDPTFGTTGLRFDDPASDYNLRAELHGLRERYRLGFRGVAQLRELAAHAREERRKRRIGLQDPSGFERLDPPRGRDRTRRPLGPRRVTAFAFMPATQWDETAKRWGGTANSLAIAVAANLLRRARQARGGPSERPLQLVLPMDVTQTAERSKRLQAGLSAEQVMTTAQLVLPGGAPAHGDLSEVRARTKAAFKADAETAPSIRGVPDAARLLPERLTLAAAKRAAVAFDGCVSHVGTLPENMMRLGPHEATQAVMFGFPIGNESLTGLMRCGDMICLSTTTDPERMGRDANLRVWLAEELHAWGFGDVVM
jgi:hypothetical protein